MDPVWMSKGFGEVVRARREARGLDLDDLSRAIGGTLSKGFLARVEEGSVGPSSSLVLKLAEVLGLPADLMLNASGLTDDRYTVPQGSGRSRCGADEVMSSPAAAARDRRGGQDAVHGSLGPVRLGQ